MQQQPRRESVVYVTQAPLPTWVPWVIGIMVVISGLMGVALLRAWSAAANERPPVVRGGGVAIQPTPHLPAPTPVGKTRSEKTEAVILAVHTVSRLETQEFELVQDTTKVRDPALLAVFGGESIQAHVVGTVIGRTDLARLALSSDLRTGDVTISEDGKQISVILPCSEIVSPVINWDKTQFPTYSYGLFSQADPALWMTALKEAAQGLVEKAKERNIRSLANEEAKRQMAVLVNLGGDFEKVYIQTGACTA
jgi:hypothetical protein